MCYVSNTSLTLVKSSIYLWKSCASATCGTLKWWSCEFHIILFKPRDEEINAEKINKNPASLNLFSVFFFLFLRLYLWWPSLHPYTLLITPDACANARSVTRTTKQHSWIYCCCCVLLCWGFRFLKSFQEKKKKSQQLFIYGTLVKKML